MPDPSALVGRTGGSITLRLERAYLKVRREPGEELMVSVEGQMKMLPPMEGTGLQSTLVVTRFIGVWPGETCGARFATSNLQNTY